MASGKPGAKYADSFAAFGSQPPAPVEDERPGVYRARLFEHLRRRSPSGHEWPSVRADDIPPSARASIEALVIDAAMAEGAKPSVDNLPPPGEFVQRVRIDPDTNERRTEFFGRRSFIADMSRPGRKVAALLTNRGTVFCGGAGSA
jgi:hypothetical protein